jgi:hypothetical protein
MLVRTHRCQDDLSEPDLREKSSSERNTEINQQEILSQIGWQFEGQLWQFIALKNSFGLAL